MFNTVVKYTISKDVFGPRFRKCDPDGFYYHTINGLRKIQSCDDIDHISTGRNVHINNLNRYRRIPCYTNINDTSTLEWRLYYCVSCVQN